ncbi:hypothetical protein AiwAL_08425 [Acidiphilium sp. AL]|uniref:hypothetical protein n=1 Tax=Acidiphilium sp. AL TaxID=2871704 RepID=UPI0021CB7D32|nr:hypothetical protein [Acidiphilium sp. AL]MCU4160133.1 hypothetical protein [Acidiphilium sp. AL]
MARKRRWLIAAAAVALPAAALAAHRGTGTNNRPGTGAFYRPVAAAQRVQGAVRPVGMMVPAFQPVIMELPPLVPMALIRQVVLIQDQMQASMAALQQFAMQPMMTASPPPGGAGFAQVTMVSVSGLRGACGESMTVVPGPNGQPVASVRRFGNGCAPVPAAMPAPVAPMSAPAQAVPHLPPGALPPPSKLIYTDYKLPQKTSVPAQQG